MAFLSFRQLAQITSSGITIAFYQLKRNKIAETMNHKLIKRLLQQQQTFISFTLNSNFNWSRW